jgi:hypothetical protein
MKFEGPVLNCRVSVDPGQYLNESVIVEIRNNVSCNFPKVSFPLLQNIIRPVVVKIHEVFCRAWTGRTPGNTSGFFSAVLKYNSSSCGKKILSGLCRGWGRHNRKIDGNGCFQKSSSLLLIEKARAKDKTYI